MTAGNDIANGRASSLTETSCCSLSRASKARRVGSASAPKVRSSASSKYFTMRLSLGSRLCVVNPRPPKIAISEVQKPVNSRSRARMMASRCSAIDPDALPSTDFRTVTSSCITTT